MKSSPLQNALPAGLVLAVALLSGCQSTTLSKLTNAVPDSVASLFGVDKEMKRASKGNPAVRCVCLWQPADGTWEGQSSRGFGGQVFFLDRDTARPVAVTGDVRIHVFDDVGPREDHGKAVHTFDFTKGAWNAFLVKTQFGPAYNIFIPYTRKGHQQAECALRIRLVEKETPTIFSDMSYVRLEGANKDASNLAESLAATAPKRRADQAGPIKSIGQISAKNGVTHVSINETPLQQQPPPTGLPRGLSPQLEARLAALQMRMPVKQRDPSQPGPTDDQARFGSPGFDAVPAGRYEATNSPDRFTAPASLSPILQNTHPLPDVKTPNAPDSSSRTRKRHTLAPAHPLDAPSASTSPIQPAHATAATAATAADRRTWLNGEPVAQRETDSYDRMIREAELAAAGHNWSHAIRLASTVDRAVRSEQASWPLDRPTPSALVARWEVQRIDMAAAGDPAERVARIESRVDDYLKASKVQLDKNKESESRRLATVAHLISRAAMESAAVNTPAAGRQPVVTPVSAVESPAVTGTQRRLARGWEQSLKSAQPTRTEHPLEAAAGKQ